MRIGREVRDGIETWWLDAPPGNLMDPGFFESLEVALEAVQDRRVAGLLIRGRGRHFSAGADRDALRPFWQDRASITRHRDLFSAIEDLPFPVVAWVEGACLGSGLELALCARLVLAAPGAMLGCPEASFGVMPGCGGTWRVTRRVGTSRALDLMLTGRLVDAEEAVQMGLVDGVVARGQGPLLAREAIHRLQRGIVR
ncbi:MAG TPA: enoyl-CoA hydratase/isomerase family protein [Myxococcota bacterium]|nr:enoyl-CoA hydratase/isomerase family protein [Myxococcota bacterium]HQK52571.1 enoyl-CoA hydratase/isomerase family protein [Myxococcota bacterium]